MKKFFIRVISIVCSIMFINWTCLSALAVNEEKAVEAINRIGCIIGALDISDIIAYGLIKEAYLELISLIDQRQLRHGVYRLMGITSQPYLHINNSVFKINDFLFTKIGIYLDPDVGYRIDFIIDSLQHRIIEIISKSLRESDIPSVSQDAQILIDALYEN